MIPLGSDNVVDRIRKNGYRACHSHDDQWLRCEDGVHAASDDLCEKDFVYTKGVVGSCEHVE